MAMSRMARSGLWARACATASAPSPASATTRQVGLGVEDQADAPAHQRVVVGEQDPGLGLGHASSVGGVGQGDVEPDLGAAARSGADPQARADQQRAFAHPPDAGALAARRECPCRRRGPAAGRRSGCVPARERDPGGAGVPGGVGQALLGHAVEHQLGLRVQRRQVGGRARAARSARREPPYSVASDRSALSSPSSSSTPGRSRRAMRRISSRLPRVVSCTSCSSLAHRRRRVVGDPLEVEQHRGQRLADLVVQLLGDPAPLGLLRRQRAGVARRPLGLQPVEHGVERPDQVGDRRVSGRRPGAVPAGAGRSSPSPGSAVPAAPARSAAGRRWRRAWRPARRRGSAPRSSRTGVETVTGPSSSRRAAATSTAALSRKIRQNKGIDTASVQSPSSPLIPA